MQICDIINRKRKAGEVSLEIEVQGTNLPDLVPYHWRVEEEGSLKSSYPIVGREYVLIEPCMFNELGPHVDYLNGYIKEEGGTVIPSYMAGTHVHVNVQDLTPKQLITYICAFLILEELLVDWCGPSRVGNHFCLRSSDAEGLITVADEKNKGLSVRYSTVNVASVLKYGSLEFRSLDSTMDKKRLLTWAGVLLRIKKMSMQYDSPAALVISLSSGGYENFALEMLGVYYDDFIKGDWKRKMRAGVLNAQDLAYAKDWDLVEINLNIFRQKESVF
jgi:hypothetical protein